MSKPIKGKEGSAMNLYYQRKGYPLLVEVNEDCVEYDPAENTLLIKLDTLNEKIKEKRKIQAI